MMDVVTSLGEDEILQVSIPHKNCVLFDDCEKDIL